ncbi:hypothetical protein AJ80_09363, partial [Polytolypa hystricis UAMH7299]
QYLVSASLSLKSNENFDCDEDNTQRFRLNKGDPAFYRLEHLGQRSFEDIYYDCIKVRKRNGNWQAKIRRQGTFANSRFEELSTPAEIVAMIRKLGLHVDPAADGFGLQQLARFTTFRETWKVNDRFEVVFDTTDFGHSVGEAELQQTIGIDDADEASVTRRKAMTADMDRQIEGFMKKYSWAFPAGKPVGKLSAYFARKE